MGKRSPLGRGLGAIFTELSDDVDKETVFSTCGIEELTPNRFQPRKKFDTDEQNALVTSVKERGIIQPIIVRKTDSGYEIIAGERRWRAAQAAGLREVPIIIRKAEDIHIAELSLIENIQREELNPVEEADAYQTLITKFNLSQEEISSRVGKDRSTIANTLRLLKLPADVKTALIQKKISAGHARALLALGSEKERISLLKEILKKNLSVRETEQWVKKRNKPSVQKVPKENYIVDLEDRLSKRFMTRINVKRSGKGGTIEIKFLSPEDLDRVLGIIMGREDM
jgi:ParB family chromosome partitioning protein